MAVSKAKDEPDIIDDDDVEEMRAELERSAAEVENSARRISANATKAPGYANNSGAAGKTETRGGRNDDYGEEHVIDLWGRSCDAWRYPNFRLFVFMVAAFGMRPMAQNSFCCWLPFPIAAMPRHTGKRR